MMLEAGTLLNNSAAGVMACAIAGIANGSFAAPMKRIKIWKWEHIWLVYSLFAYGILPSALALLLAPRVITHVISGAGTAVFRVALFGALWGFGSVLFGLSLVRLGLAVGNAFISSLIVLLGSLGPVLAGGVAVNRRDMIAFMLTLGPLIGGIILCGAAAASRERAKVDGTRGRHGNAVVGILLAAASGVLSSLLNIGFAAGDSLAAAARAQAVPAPLDTLAIWIPILAGGLMVNLLFTGRLIQKGRSWKSFHTTPEAAGAWAKSFAMAVLWFGAIFAYGSGAMMMGPTGPMYGWAMAVGGSIIAANLWGLATGEWRGSGPRPKWMMAIATALLIISFVILAAQRGGSAT